MPTNSRPLWKLLLDTAEAKPEDPLTCADCFTILEYLADTDIVGLERQRLFKSARQHLHACPDCLDYCLRRLEEMEQSQRKS